MPDRDVYEFAEYLIGQYETTLRVLDSEFDSSAEAVAEIDAKIAELRAELAALRGA